jgi:hypothetical protein
VLAAPDLQIESDRLRVMMKSGLADFVRSEINPASSSATHVKLLLQSTRLGEKRIVAKGMQSPSRIMRWQRSHRWPLTGFELRSTYSPLRSGQCRQLRQQCHTSL